MERLPIVENISFNNYNTYEEETFHSIKLKPIFDVGDVFQFFHLPFLLFHNDNKIRIESTRSNQLWIFGFRPNRKIYSSYRTWFDFMSGWALFILFECRTFQGLFRMLAIWLNGNIVDSCDVIIKISTIKIFIKHQISCICTDWAAYATYIEAALICLTALETVVKRR